MSVDKIIEDVLGEDESDNPLNALKNLVYRTRVLLKSLKCGQDVEFIKHTNGTYAWNNEIECNIDCQEFDYYIAKRKQEDCSLENKKKYLMEAVKRYQGEFLPKSATASWVIVQSSYYLSPLYLNSVVALYIVLLTIKDQYKSIFTKALADIVENLKNALLNSLRKGDIISQYSASQIALMLPMATIENINSITKRIKSKFYANSKNKPFEIMVNMQHIKPYDEGM